jgi:hypothetical protein
VPDRQKPVAAKRSKAAMLRVRTAQGVFVGVAAHYDVDVAALLEVRIEDRFAGRALAPAWVPWRIRRCPLIHQMMCYTKLLKSHKERVRPQFLSLRQDALERHSLCAEIGALKPRNSAIFG